jgi:hypothetical protein
MRMPLRLLLAGPLLAVMAITSVSCSSMNDDPPATSTGPSVTIDEGSAVQDIALGYLAGVRIPSLPLDTAAVPFWCCEQDDTYRSGGSLRSEVPLDATFVAGLAGWIADNEYTITGCSPADLVASVDLVAGIVPSSGCPLAPGLSVSGRVLAVTAERAIDDRVLCELSVTTDPGMSPAQAAIYLQCLGDARR